MNRSERRKESRFRKIRKRMRHDSNTVHAYRVGMREKGVFARLLHWIAMRNKQ